MQVANWANAAAFQSHEEYIFDKLLAMRDLLAEKHIDFIKDLIYRFFVSFKYFKKWITRIDRL